MKVVYECEFRFRYRGAWRTSFCSGAKGVKEFINGFWVDTFGNRVTEASKRVFFITPRNIITIERVRAPTTAD